MEPVFAALVAFAVAALGAATGAAKARRRAEAVRWAAVAAAVLVLASWLVAAALPAAVCESPDRVKSTRTGPASGRDE